jgi:arabinofuranosyltransferase
VLILIFITTNRTFLTWTSSGLETAMFNFFIFLWIYCCLYISSQNPFFLFSISSTAVLIGLTRPDGLLFIMAAIVLMILYVIKNKNKLTALNLISFTPFLLIALHFIYRKRFYGEWLPNTYYAKVSKIWPECGVRYAFAFLLEYGIWLWIFVTFLSFLYFFFVTRKKTGHHFSFKNLWKIDFTLSARILVIFTITVHILYYTIAVGGDHFEYRVYSYLIVLFPITFVWMLNYVNFKPFVSMVLMASFVLISYPVPWSHWYLTDKLPSNTYRFRDAKPIAGSWPKYFRWYADAFDDTLSWLNFHMSCIRHYKHRSFHQNLVKNLPSREEGLLFPDKDFPVLLTGAVGVVSWTLPKINILDKDGLNDYVAARNIQFEGGVRLMAHSRELPKGYIRCLSPNVRFTFTNEWIVIEKREKKLTKEDIIECEKLWEEKINILKLSYNQQKDTIDSIRYFSNFWQTSFDYDVAFDELKSIIADDKKSDTEKAIQILLALKAFYPQSAFLHYRLGRLYNKNFKYDKAIKEYKQALTFEPGMIKSMSDLAAIYYHRGEYEKSISCYKNMITVKPNLSTLYYNIACIYSFQNNVDESIIWLKKAIAKGYKDWETIKNDNDLQNIRHTPFYQNVIESH